MLKEEEEEEEEEEAHCTEVKSSSSSMLMPTRDIVYLSLYTRIHEPNIQNPLHAHLGLAYSLVQLSVWDDE